MQFKFNQDFFIRPLLPSDQSDVVELVRKYQTADFAEQLSDKFSEILKKSPSFLRVLLNSNGMLFGSILYYDGAFQSIAINPNFRGNEAKEVIFQELKKWAIDHSGGSLSVAPGLIVGAWRTFFVKAGAKLELVQNEVKSLSFN